MVVVSPLLGWLPELQRKAARHADVPGVSLAVSAPQGTSDLREQVEPASQPVLLQRNLGSWLPRLVEYLGWPTLLLALVGIAAAPSRRQRSALFLALVWVSGLVLTLTFTRTFFSRYMLFTTFPLYVLGAVAAVWLAGLVCRKARQAWPKSRLVNGRRLEAFVLTTALAVQVGAVAPFTFLLVEAPRQAPLPRGDRAHYLEGWTTLYGFAEMVGYLQDEARAAPISLVVAPSQHFDNQLFASNALRFAFRDQPNVRFVESNNLMAGTTLCDLRSRQDGGRRTYLAVAGSRDLPLAIYSSNFEATRRRDLPEAHVAQRFVDSASRGWLTLYQLDGASTTTATSATGPGTTGCLVPQRSFVSGWGAPVREAGPPLVSRQLLDRATYAEGPLPEGWYRPRLWARAGSDQVMLSIGMNGVELEQQMLEAADGWTWIETKLAGWLPQGATGTLTLEAAVIAPGPGGGETGTADSSRAPLTIRQINLLRD
jgi:hypothetical protein